MKKIDWLALLQLLLYIIVALVFIGCVAASITACVEYGDKPITEIPAWALWFMFGGRK